MYCQAKSPKLAIAKKTNPMNFFGRKAGGQRTVIDVGEWFRKNLDQQVNTGLFTLLKACLSSKKQPKQHF